MEQKIMHVFFPNREVRKHNEDMVKKLKSKLMAIVAKLQLPKGRKSFTDPNKGTIGNTEFLETLKIGVGARCMIIINMDIKDNLVNGQCGTVVGIEKNAKGKIYSIIVDFDDPSCGAAQRQNHKNLSEKYNGTPIFQVQHEFQLASRRGWAHSARAKLRQFPLRLAYAQTAHKTQVSL